MNQKTEANEGGVRRILFGLLGLLLLLAAFYYTWMRGHPASFYPWVIAARITMQEGLNGLSGGSSLPAGRYDVLSALLIGFVVCPALFFFGWRSLRTGQRSRAAAMLLLVIGGAVTVSVSVPSFPDALRSRKRLVQEKEQRAAWSAKDNLMQALNIVALDAQSYWILPPAKGGGNKNFEGYRIPARLESHGTGRVAIVKLGTGELRLRGWSTDYPESSVLLELDGAGNRYSFSYEGAFRL